MYALRGYLELVWYKIHKLRKVYHVMLCWLASVEKLITVKAYLCMFSRKFDSAVVKT